MVSLWVCCGALGCHNTQLLIHSWLYKLSHRTFHMFLLLQNQDLPIKRKLKKLVPSPLIIISTVKETVIQAIVSRMQDIRSKVRTRTWALAIEPHDSHDFSHLFHSCLDLLRDVVLLYCPLCLACPTSPSLVLLLPSKSPCSGSWLEYLTKCVTFTCPSLMFSTLTMYLRAGSSSLIFLHLDYIDRTRDFAVYQCLNVRSMSLTVWKQFEVFKALFSTNGIR